jgi:hypothetical protein
MIMEQWFKDDSQGNIEETGRNPRPTTTYINTQSLEITQDGAECPACS